MILRYGRDELSYEDLRGRLRWRTPTPPSPHTSANRRTTGTNPNRIKDHGASFVGGQVGVGGGVGWGNR